MTKGFLLFWVGAISGVKENGNLSAGERKYEVYFAIGVPGWACRHGV